MRLPLESNQPDRVQKDPALQFRRDLRAVSTHLNARNPGIPIARVRVARSDERRLAPQTELGSLAPRRGASTCADLTSPGSSAPSGRASLGQGLRKPGATGSSLLERTNRPKQQRVLSWCRASTRRARLPLARECTRVTRADRTAGRWRLGPRARRVTTVLVLGPMVCPWPALLPRLVFALALRRRGLPRQASGAPLCPRLSRLSSDRMVT